MSSKPPRPPELQTADSILSSLWTELGLERTMDPHGKRAHVLAENAKAIANLRNRIGYGIATKHADMLRDSENNRKPTGGNPPSAAAEIKIKIRRMRVTMHNDLRIYQLQGKEAASANLDTLVDDAFVKLGSDIAVITSAGQINESLIAHTAAPRLATLGIEMRHLATARQGRTAQENKLGHTLFLWKKDLASTHDIETDDSTTILEATAKNSARIAGYRARLKLTDKRSKRALLIVGIYVRPCDYAGELRAALAALAAEASKDRLTKNVDYIELGDYNAIIDEKYDEERTQARNSVQWRSAPCMEDYTESMKLTSAWHSLHPNTKQFSHQWTQDGRTTRRLIDHALNGDSIKILDMDYCQDSVDELVSDHFGFTVTLRSAHRFQRVGSNRSGLRPHGSYVRLKKGSEKQWAEAARLAEEMLKDWVDLRPLETPEDIDTAGEMINRILLRAAEKAVGYTNANDRERKPECDKIIKTAKRARKRLRRLLVQAVQLRRELHAELIFQDRAPNPNFIELCDEMERIALGDEKVELPLIEDRIKNRAMETREQLLSSISAIQKVNSMIKFGNFARMRLTFCISHRSRKLGRIRNALRNRDLLHEIVDSGEHGAAKFDIAKRFRGRKSHPITSVEYKDKIFTTAEEVIEHATDHYEDFQKDAIAEPRTLHWLLDQVNKIPESETCKMDQDIQDKELDAAISAMKAEGAAGRPLVPPMILKYLKTDGRQTLKRLLQACWDKGVVPEDWKEGLVCGIYKGKGSTADMESRRPIALLDIISKLYARILKQRLESALEDNKILSELQKGFRRGKDCTEAARMIVTAIKQAQTEDANLNVVFVDLAKAFDTVPVWLIRRALAAHGVSEKLTRAILSLYEGYGLSYLTAYGSSKRVDASKRGEKQGCPLSPIIFTLILNPVLHEIESKPEEYAALLKNRHWFGAVAVADDVALTSTSPEKVEKMWELFVDYAKYADLRINPDKTRILSTKQNAIVPDDNASCASSGSDCSERARLCTLKYNGATMKHLAPNESYKYLGLDVNALLDWNDHEKRISETVMKKTALIAHLPALSMGTKAQLIQAVIPATVAYTARVILPSQSFLRTCDSYVARSLRKSIHATQCNDWLTLALFGIDVLETTIPCRHLKAIATKPMISEDKMTASMETVIVSTTANDWNDAHFVRATTANSELQTTHPDNALSRIEHFRAANHGIPPVNVIAEALGLCLVTGGNSQTLRSADRPTNWQKCADEVMKTNADKLATEARTILDLEERWRHTEHTKRWLACGTDGSARTIQDNGQDHRALSASVVLTTELPLFKDEYWISENLPPTLREMALCQTSNHKSWSGVGFGNGNGISYVAEAHAMILLLKIQRHLQCNIFLFSDSLSLLSQITKWRRLGKRYAQKQYTKYGCELRTIDTLLDQVESDGLTLRFDHVFSHTDDAVDTRDMNDAREAKRMEQKTRLDLILKAFRGEGNDTNSPDDTSARLKRVAAEARSQSQTIRDYLARCAKGEIECADLKHLEPTDFLAAMAELAKREASLLQEDKAAKSNQEKIAEMDVRYGENARRLAVGLNKKADEICSATVKRTYPLAPCVAGMPRVAVTTHDGLPLLGKLSSELEYRASLIVKKQVQQTSGGRLIAPLFERTSTLYPLSLEAGKSTKPRGNGGLVGELAFKLLTNTLHTGRKALKIGGKPIRAIDRGSTEIELPMNVTVTKDTGASTEARIRDALRDFARLQRDLAVPSFQRAAGPRSKYKLSFTRDGLQIKKDGQPAGMSNDARELACRELNCMVALDMEDRCEDACTTGSRVRSVTLVEGKSERVLSKTFLEQQLTACPFCAVDTAEGLPIPMASSQHVTATCRFVGRAIAGLLWSLNEIWKEHAGTRPGDERLQFTPWFSVESAIDWATEVDRNSSESMACEILNLSTERKMKLAETFTVTADTPEVTAKLRRFVIDNLTERNQTERLKAYSKWAREDGDRGAVPLELKERMEKSKLCLRDLCLKRMKVAWLTVKTRLWRRYDITRKRCNAIIQQEDSAKALKSLEDMIAVQQRNAITHHFTPLSAEDRAKAQQEHEDAEMRRQRDKADSQRKNTMRQYFTKATRDEAIEKAAIEAERCARNSTRESAAAGVETGTTTTKTARRKNEIAKQKVAEEQPRRTLHRHFSSTTRDEMLTRQAIEAKKTDRREDERAVPRTASAVTSMTANETGAAAPVHEMTSNRKQQQHQQQQRREPKQQQPQKLRGTQRGPHRKTREGATRHGQRPLPPAARPKIDNRPISPAGQPTAAQPRDGVDAKRATKRKPKPKQEPSNQNEITRYFAQAAPRAASSPPGRATEQRPALAAAPTTSGKIRQVEITNDRRREELLNSAVTSTDQATSKLVNVSALAPIERRERGAIKSVTAFAKPKSVNRGSARAAVKSTAARKPASSQANSEDDRSDPMDTDDTGQQQLSIISGKCAALTLEERNELEAWPTSGPPGDIVLSGEGPPAFELRRSDLARLEPSAWLNDEIVNRYMWLIVEHCQKQAADGEKRVHAFNTFFLSALDRSYDRVKRWTRQLDLFALEKLLIPVHLGNHWCMLVVDFVRKQVSYFDSMGGKNPTATRAVLRYLANDYRDKKGGELDVSDWKTHDPGANGVPQQENDYDCGLFACRFAALAAHDLPFEFSQEDMPRFRKRFLLDLVRGKLSG